MNTVQIKIDDALLEATKLDASSQGKSLDEYVAKLLAERVRTPQASMQKWAREFLEATRRSKGNSGGWKWNRDELHDR